MLSIREWFFFLEKGDKTRNIRLCQLSKLLQLIASYRQGAGAREGDMESRKKGHGACKLYKFVYVCDRQR